MRKLKNGLITLALLLCCVLVLCSGAAAYAEEAGNNVVQVSTVDELLAAIAPNTEIVLAPGEYNLTQASNYARGGGEWYHWESVYDGVELVITDLSGLTIRGEDQDTVSIVTEPRYANVMRFDFASGITISNVTMGHTPEKGSCAGGVLLFQDCSDLEIVRSGLYGCGIRGVDLRGCRNVHVDWTDIYECSEGCVAVSESRNVLFENCKFYRCTVWMGVFEVYGSRDVAFINSEVFENSGIYPEYGSLVYSSCPGVYLGGLDVHENSFASLFTCNNHAATVEKCRFTGNSGAFASDLAPVSADRTELTAGDIANMSMRTVTWEPATAPETVAPEADVDGKIHVTTVDEFLAAIGRDTVIYLEPGVYDLSQAENYGGFGTEFYHWEDTFDGPELVIQGVSGLTIEGAGKDQVTITAAPRYANVLRFENCYGLILRGFLAGHTMEPGYCSGGVLQMTYCSNVNIEQCGLYGCGILGIWAMGCSNLYVTGTEIYECSSGAASFYNCSDVSLDACDVHDIGGTEYYADFFCTNIFVNGEPVANS